MNNYNCNHIWLNLPKKKNNKQFFWCMKCKLAGNKQDDIFIDPRVFTKEELDTVLNRFDS